MVLFFVLGITFYSLSPTAFNFPTFSIFFKSQMSYLFAIIALVIVMLVNKKNDYLD